VEIFFIVFFFMVVLVVAMSVGVLFGKKPISGSCGGMSALGMEVACDICGGDKTRCDNEDSSDDGIEETNLAYDAANTTASK
jgi:hypothetical protein